MLQDIYDWMRDILLFMIGTAMILNLITKSSYLKYAKFVSGILLILLLIKPVLTLIDKSGQFSFSQKAYESLFRLEEETDYIKDAQDMKDHAVMTEYKRLLTEQTQRLLEDKGLRLSGLEIYMEEDSRSEQYGNIRGLTVFAAYPQDAGKEGGAADIVIERIIVAIGEEGQERNPAETQGGSALEISVKNVLADFYNLDAAHINIIIQEDGNG